MNALKRLIESLTKAELAELKIQRLVQEVPQAHEWKAGDWAKHKKVNSVFKVVKVRQDYTNDTWLYDKNDIPYLARSCTPIQNPEMPKLPHGFILLADGKIQANRTSGIMIIGTLEQMINYHCELTVKSEPVIKGLIALREWRELVEWECEGGGE